MTDDTDPVQCMSCQRPATEDSDYCIGCLVKAQSTETDE